MDAFVLYHPMDEIVFQLDLFTNYSQYCVPCVLMCLLISYCVYSSVLWSCLEETKIPKLYKITTLHSLWMGSMNLIISILCFSQLRVHTHTSAKSSHPFFIIEILYAATANFSQHSTEYNTSILNSNPSKDPGKPVGEIEWTSFNAISIFIIYAVLIQEILLATRNKMNYILYSRLLGLVFVVSAIRTRCPLVSIQGMYLMSINTSSKEIARALVAWKSYSQEDSDRRPSPVVKAVTFVFFVFHMIIWFSLMLFYMPFFIHKLPPITESDPSRLFLAYTYMSCFAYLMLEAGTSPLWRTVRCMGWCRRSSGITWRIMALSDCHLLDHYSPLVIKLYHIQVILDQRKALFRNKMVQKHWETVERRKWKPAYKMQANRPPSLLAAVKTVVALKKKIRRRIEEMPAHSVTLEDLPQVITEAEDSNIETDLLDKEVEIALIDLRQDSHTSKTVSEEIPGLSDEAKKDPTIEKDEVNSIESVLEATLLKEGEESLADQGTLHRRDSADVIQD